MLISNSTKENPLLFIFPGILWYFVCFMVPYLPMIKGIQATFIECAARRSWELIFLQPAVLVLRTKYIVIADINSINRWFHVFFTGTR